MIKAALLTPNLSVGGAERWIATLVKHSDPSRLQWTGVALSGWGGCDPELCHELAQCTQVVSGPPRSEVVANAPEDRPPPAIFSPLPDDLVEVDSLPAAVRRITADAQVLLTWGGYRFSGMLNRPELPVVLCSHSSHSKPHKFLPRDGVTYLTAVSEAAARPFDVEGNPPVTIVHNGADETRLRPRHGRSLTRMKWGFNDKLVVGYVGRFSVEKNPNAAIEAVRVLGDPWRAVYYGELPARQQPAEPDLLGEIQRDGSHQVHVYKHVADVGDVYAGLDVLMLASHTEAFSMTMIEAWLTGVPIVSTPVGAVPELERLYGPLVISVPLNPTPQQLAAACQKAISPEGMAIAVKAQALAREHWTAKSMVDRWTDYLEVAVSKRAIPGGLFQAPARLRYDLDL